MDALRAILTSGQLDQTFWLKTAEVVLQQAGSELSKEAVEMLATCSEQANKAKVLGGKGLSDFDPLAFLRQKAEEVLGGHHA